jgi:hypothetical protein
MATIVYVLSGLTCLVCTILLLRAYRSSGTRLLLWSGLCFLGFTLNNILLILDLIVFTQTDLYLWRSAPTLIGLLLLLYGLIWESES